MVRSLVIRQTFVVLDLLLAIAVLGAAGVIVFELFQPQVQAREIEPGSPLDAADVESVELPQVGVRADYQGIVAARLFGKSGQFIVPEEPAEEPEDPKIGDTEDIPETALNLTLMGVLHSGEESVFSSATIRDKNTRDQPKVYFLGDEVASNVTVAGFGKRQVILLNRRLSPTGVHEKLTMDEEEQVAANRPARAVPPPSSSSRISVSRNELITEMTENYSELMKVQPRLARDKSGRVLGITADNISKYGLAQKLGLRDGDILQEINGERIDSQEKILEMVNKYRNSNAFRLSITREDGSSRVITTTLR